MTTARPTTANDGTSPADAETERVIEATEAFLAANDPVAMADQEFLGAQFDHGLAWVHFGEGHGGLGVNPRLQAVATRRIRSAGGPVGGAANPIGYGMCGPAVEVHGTEEQKKLLRPLFTNEHIWCQLFSEPGAGSDVASLATRAERDGEQWVLNGQKVWTTPRPRGALWVADRAIRSRAPQAPWNHRVHRRHDRAGGRDTTVAPDDR
ncbi:MAG: acyl-CoA dehydrogenase family protein [Microthrixaceae bacterium]|nr:acyl-CoA dehydrogenase family protein [Microthrixaceae bacterium]